MIVPNLNPKQMSQLSGGMRPQSASLRTPRGGDGGSARMRSEGQATPRVAAPEKAPAPGEEEPWLFRFERNLTTGDLWRMGFSRVLVFGAHHWGDEAVAAAELSEAFRCQEPLKGLGAEHKAALEAAIAPVFLRGDVLLAVQCSACGQLPPDEAARCYDAVAKLIDCVSNVWVQYDEISPHLATSRHISPHLGGCRCAYNPPTPARGI